MLKNNNKDILLVSIPVLLIIALYYQVAWFTSYTNWDTPIFITNNQFLQKISFHNLINIFTPGKIHREILFIPITYFSYLMEISIFGINTSIIHIDNVILHILNTILLYYFIILLFKNRTAAFVASLIFAIHPIQVEAVCWLMGRKDLLMALFSLLTCIFWVKKIYTNKSMHFVLSLIFLILACLSKPTALILPLLLLLIYFLINKKENVCYKIIQVLPFFLCSIIIYYINTIVPKITDGTIPYKFSPILHTPSIIFGWCYRLFLLTKSEIAYTILKTDPTFQFNFIFSITLVILFLVFLYIFYKKIKSAVFCFLFTAISFLPALSAILSKRAIVTADRYGYFPLIGLYILIGIITSVNDKTWVKLCKYCILFFWTLGMLITTYTLIPAWQSTESLWKYELKVNKNSPFGLHNMAMYCFDQGETDLALKLFLKTSKLVKYKDTFFNIAEIYRYKNNIDRTIIYYKKAIDVDNNNSDYHGSLGAMYLKKNMLKEALSEFVTVTKLKPNEPKAYLFISEIFNRNKEYKKAAEVHRIYEEKKKIKEE
jgi:protein O-mannosyl-transferase